VQVTLDAEAREPSAGPGVVRRLVVAVMSVVVVVVVLLLLLLVVAVALLATFLLGGPFGRRGRRRGRVGGDEAHAVRVGRLLVLEHQYALAGGRGHEGRPSSRLDRRHRAGRGRGRRRRRRRLAVVGRHVNGQHRQAAEKHNDAR